MEQAEAFFADKPIQGRMHESLRMWSICNAMKWNHLPVAGGIYDQHPAFLDDVLVIFEAKYRKERADAKKREQEMKSKRGKRR